MGRQLAWYDDVNEPDSAAAFPELALMNGHQPVPPFHYRWPDITEQFEGGWRLTVQSGMAQHEMKIGVGNRPAYGRMRRRIVAWVDGQPAVERVGADNYPHTGRLASLLKRADGHLVRPAEAPASGYDGFPVARLADIVTGPHVRDALAAHLHEQDVTAWAGYALARRQVSRAASPVPAAQAASPAPAGRWRWCRSSWRTGSGTPKSRPVSLCGTPRTRRPTPWCSRTRSRSCSPRSLTRESPRSARGGPRTNCGSGSAIWIRYELPTFHKQSSQPLRRPRLCTAT